LISIASISAAMSVSSSVVWVTGQYSG
jgi:hypothetical protein